MTIVKNTLVIRHHPHTAIDEEVVDLILQGAEAKRISSNLNSYSIIPKLKVLEAYCDITGDYITMETLRSPAIEKILDRFTTAMAGKALVDLSRHMAMTYCRSIHEAIITARLDYPDIYPITWNSDNFKPDPIVCASIALTATDLQRWYWKGWSISGRHYASVHLRLAQLVVPYGRDFVQNVYNQIEQYFRNRVTVLRHNWNHMFDYMRKNHDSWPLYAFKTEAGVRQFMQEFTVFSFTTAKDANLDAKSLIKSWTPFIKSVEDCLCKSGIWASLSSPIRRPPIKHKHGSQTRIKQDVEGLLTQEKLLTSIPLQITDNEAMEILFHYIKRDITTVRKWATAQAEIIKARCDARIRLANKGNVINCYSGGRNLHKLYTLADVCATFESTEHEVPIAFLCKIFNNCTNTHLSAFEIATILGFPTRGSLFPFECLLVLEHPQITTEFLRRFELYNKHGHMVGFNEQKRILIGYKDRKTPEAREQIIHLNETSFNLIKDIIEITSLTRRSLRAQSNDDWRYLLIASGQAFRPLEIHKTTRWNDGRFASNQGLRQKLLTEFKPHSDLPDNELIEFIKRVRLTTIRSSRAVEIFIQSRSSEEMSKALGHERYNADLLSHYLPDAIMAFIKARWIRIFQKSLVCEAMKESPYFLRATRFNSMEELHIFFENHRIRDIPIQASDPERLGQRKEIKSSEAVFSIGVPFLSSLLSLQVAVEGSKERHRVCGKAEYWASLADKITKEITSGVNRALKKHLKSAIELVDSTKMEDLIYVPHHWR